MTGVEEQLQACKQLITRDLVQQVPYKSARRQEKFTAAKAIEFIVGGEKGIRLSDALEGNWVGLEGRDDRHLFGGDPRLQILIRLHVRQPLGL